MKILEVQFTPLTKPYWFDPKDHDLKVGEYVIVKTELGVEIGKVLSIKDIQPTADQKIKPILRKANLSDIEKIEEKNKHKKEALETCRKLVEKNKLDMKVVDIYYSFDGGRITFYFTASGRVDFRELVKELTHHFQKSIRLHQIGVRDEAKHLGEFGPCGKGLCCRKFLDKLEQISSDFADMQQVAHRGSDRLTGVCGRLKCCLRYEQGMYEDLCHKLPAIDSRIKTPQGHGTVVSQQVLKQSVKVALDDDPETLVDVEV